MRGGEALLRRWRVRNTGWEVEGEGNAPCLLKDKSLFFRIRFRFWFKFVFLPRQERASRFNPF